MAPKMKKLTLVAVAAVAGNVDQESDFIIKATIKSCIHNDLLTVIYVLIEGICG